jgi:hypothetical protein
MRLGRLSAAD